MIKCHVSIPKDIEQSIIASQNRVDKYVDERQPSLFNLCLFQSRLLLIDLSIIVISLFVNIQTMVNNLLKTKSSA
jgi:hypothetical protein